MGNDDLFFVPLQVVTDRKMLATDNILKIKKEVTEKTKAKEQEWQNNVARWLATGTRKIEIKEKEDADAELQKRKRRRNV